MHQASEGLVQRKTQSVVPSSGLGGSSELTEDKRDSDSEAEDHDKQTRLSLMEEVLLLGLKDREVGLIK